MVHHRHPTLPLAILRKGTICLDFTSCLNCLGPRGFREGNVRSKSSPIITELITLLPPLLLPKEVKQSGNPENSPSHRRTEQCQKRFQCQSPIMCGMQKAPICKAKGLEEEGEGLSSQLGFLHFRHPNFPLTISDNLLYYIKLNEGFCWAQIRKWRESKNSHCHSLEISETGRTFYKMQVGKFLTQQETCSYIYQERRINVYIAPLLQIAQDRKYPRGRMSR